MWCDDGKRVIFADPKDAKGMAADKACLITRESVQGRLKRMGLLGCVYLEC